MRICFVSPRQCWPAVSGAKLREYHLARALGEHADLTYVYFMDPASPALRAEDVPFCREVIGVPRPKSYSAGRIARGIAGKWPLPVENYTSSAMIRALLDVAGANRFDLFHLDSIHMAACADALSRAVPDFRAVYDWHNIESEAMLRFASGPEAMLKRAYAWMTARRLMALERNLLNTALGHLVCSQRERDQLIAATPQARISVIENGVDTSRFQPVESNSGRRRLVYVGQMSYHANAEAAVRFTRAIWPGVRTVRPDLKLTIVGSNPGPEVLALAADEGVEVTGTVPDVGPYYADAFAAIVPLRVGGGTRLKILEAMAAGVPVISTALGAEGLAVNPGVDITIAEADADWAAAIQALSDPETWRAFAERGRELAVSRYDWRHIGRRLFDTYVQWLAVEAHTTGRR